MEKGEKKKFNGETCARLFRAFFFCRQFEGATAFPV